MTKIITPIQGFIGICVFSMGYTHRWNSMPFQGFISPDVFLGTLTRCFASNVFNWIEIQNTIALSIEFYEILNL